MASWQSKLLKTALRLVRLNRDWKRTGDDLRRYLEAQQRKGAYVPPKSMQAKYVITKRSVDGFACYELEPRRSGAGRQRHLIYLHGGGYALPITDLHWQFIGKLLDRTGCTVTVPLYPLAPAYSHEAVYRMLDEVYADLWTRRNPAEVTLIGDSAGGGLCLAFAQWLRESGRRPPDKLVLLSPALDMTFSNPAIAEVERKDPILAAAAVQDIARWYAGGTDVKDYRISPLYGDLTGLGAISLYTGTCDICHPDAVRLRSAALGQGIELQWREYADMLHVWPLFELPESKQAFGQIALDIEA